MKIVEREKVEEGKIDDKRKGEGWQLSLTKEFPLFYRIPGGERRQEGKG